MTLSIPYRNADTGNVEHKTVKATIVRGTVFAITQPIGHGERWTLTHCPTGFRVSGANTQAPLRAMAKRLNALPSALSLNVDVIKADGAAWLPIIRESLFGVSNR